MLANIRRSERWPESTPGGGGSDDDSDEKPVCVNRRNPAETCPRGRDGVAYQARARAHIARAHFAIMS